MYQIGQPEIDALAETIKRFQIFRYFPDSQTQQLEKTWAAMTGTKHCLATNSGTSSLICGLAALGIGPGDEVIIPGYTFIATAAAVLAVGAIPILAEIDETLTLDALDVEAKISPYTKAIIPVHIQGFPCDLTALLAVAKRHQLAVLEDACQANGGSFQGQRLGSYGDAGAFSFNFYKIIGAGEGGALVTSTASLHAAASIQHDCGSSFFADAKHTTPQFMGWNFRLSELLGAVMVVQVARLDGILAALRAEKSFVQRELAGSVEFAPSHDAAGDCGTTLALRFPTVETCTNAIAAATAAGVPGIHAPINTDRHVYVNWQAVLEQRGAHHPERNPYRFAKRPIIYSKDMLPRTLDLLARTAYVPMHLAHSQADWQRIANGLRAAVAQTVS
jgi:8-amino-3,8-dideoxy-alpha-D-manno-octulosonate transaminase